MPPERDSFGQSLFDRPCQGAPVNDRNVTALALALQGAPGTAGLPLDAIARHLAGRGVIAAVALTDDEAVKLGADAAGTVPTEPGEIALCVREGLARVARG
jgi:hypothetical protein